MRACRLKKFETSVCSWQTSQALGARLPESLARAPDTRDWTRCAREITLQFRDESLFTENVIWRNLWRQIQEFCGVKLKQILIIGCEQLVGSLWKNGLAIKFYINPDHYKRIILTSYIWYKKFFVSHVTIVPYFVEIYTCQSVYVLELLPDSKVFRF